MVTPAFPTSVPAGRVLDPARLAAWEAARLAGAPALPELERIAELTRRLLGVPAVLVCLVGAQEELVHGAAPPALLAACPQVPLAHALCRSLVDTDEALVVPDTHLDPRTRDATFVTAHGVRSCAAFGLRSADGQTVGALCALDTEARPWPARTLEVLAGLADAASLVMSARMAEQESLRSATRMQAVLDSSGEAYVCLDADGLVTAWNAASEDLFGWAAPEVLGRPLSEFVIPPRLRLAHERAMRRVRLTGTSDLAAQRVELPAVDRSGREFPVELLMHATYELSGLAFHAFLHEISDRTEARVQLEQERSFLGALLDSLDAGVVACDAGGRLALVNRAFERICATPAGDGSDGTSDAATVDLDRDGLRALGFDTDPLARAAAGEHVHDAELALRAPGRQPRYFRANAQPITGDGPDQLGAVLTLTEVTEQRRAAELERALRRAQCEFERFTERIQDFLWAIEVLPDGAARVVYASRTKDAVFGGPAPFEEGQLAPEQDVVPADRPAHEAFLARLESGAPAEVTCRTVGVDGQVRLIWTRAFPREEDGRRYVEGISSDVTGRPGVVPTPPPDRTG